MTTQRTVLFVALYYLVWFCCLYGASINMGYQALIFSCFISFYQTLYFLKVKHASIFILWLLVFTVTGYTIDSLLQSTDMIIFKYNLWGNNLAPPWILGLWVNFAVLCFGLRDFLIRLIRYMPLLSLFGFPLAYYAGIKFNVAQYGYPILSPLLQGLIWSVLFSIYIYVLKVFKTYE